MELDEQSEAGQSERLEKDRRETGQRQESYGEETEEQMSTVAAENIRQGARAKTTAHNIEGNISDLGEKHCGPKQVKLSQYPQHNFGLKKRSFNSNWFGNFPWLEYSVSRDAAFCFSCRMFGKNVKHDTFVSTGQTNWKKSLDLFREHEKTPAHKASMLSWHSFKTSAVHGSVIEQLHSANEAEIKDRREYLTRIVAVTQFLAKQNIPFRGHDEGGSSHNQGNFLECLNLLKQFDPFFKSYSAPSHSTYLSPASQNEIIECCAEEVTANIVRELKEAGMFSVMADEARDGNTEQLAICVRYVAEDTVKECLLAMTTLKEFDADSITAAIEEQLVHHAIDKLKCVAQSYDGAAVMSGAVGGVQARFKTNHPEAVYVHCYAHQLNLVLCHTCQAIPEARDLFDLLQSVYSFFSVSLVNHHKFRDVQNQLGLQPSELVQLSKTRWSSQLRSVNAILENLPAVLQCLSSINNSMAVGLHAKLSRFSTVYLLVMFKTFLSVTENLHKYLQCETVDLAKAVEYKGAVCDTLKQMRTDEKATMLYETVRTICAENQIPEPCATRQRQKQKRMEVYQVESSCGAMSDLSDAEKLKRNLFLPCLDRMVAEMDQRFSSLNNQILRGVQACNPGSDSFLCEERLRGLSDHYKIDLKSEEILVAKNYLAHKMESLSNIQCVFNLLDKVMFPTLTQVLQVSLTIPVNSCSCERSFSVLRRLHTWLRSTMGQDRLHHLALLSVEREELGKLSQSQVIDRFAKMKHRRYSLMLKK